MKTTLNEIRKHDPCKDGWEKLLLSLCKTKADNEPLDLLTILNSNGLMDTIWCFRAVDGYDEEIRGFARWCALQNIKKIEPYCTIEDYTLIIEWLETGNVLIRSAARVTAESVLSTTRSVSSSARSAAFSASDSVAYSAYSASDSAQDSAAWSVYSAARLAAYSAARAAAYLAQEVELRVILGKQG